MGLNACEFGTAKVATSNPSSNLDPVTPKNDPTNSAWITSTPGDYELNSNFSRLKTNGGYTASALNDQGEAILVWTQYVGYGYYLLKSERDKNGVWKHPKNLSESFGMSSSASVALNNQGQAVIVWPVSNGIRVIERSANGKWKDDKIVHSRGGGFAPTLADSNTHVAIADSGEISIIYYSQNLNTTLSRYVELKRNAQGQWNTPTTFLPSMFEFPSGGVVTKFGTYKMNSSGFAVFGFSFLNNLYKAERSSSGIWTVPADLSETISLSESALASGGPDVALAENGNAIIVWAQPSSNGSSFYSVYKCERDEFGTWTTPATLADHIGHPDAGTTNWRGARATINSNGETIIVYQNTTEGYYISEKAANGTWTHPATSTSFNGIGYLNTLEVSMNSSGQAQVYAISSISSIFKLFVSNRASNGTWAHYANESEAISLHDDGSSAFYFNGAINENGQSVIAWQQGSGGSTLDLIYIAEKSASDLWSKPSDISDQIGLSGFDLSTNSIIASNAKGLSILLWIINNGSNKRLAKAERRADGTWIWPSSDLFISPAGSDVSKPVAKINNRGEILINWVQSNGSKNALYRMFKNQSGVWDDAPLISEHVSFASGNISSSLVELNDRGDAVMSWIESDGTANQLYKSQKIAGANWINPVDITDNVSPASTAVYSQSLALNNEGDALLAWSQTDGTFRRIYLAERSPDGTWTQPSDLNSSISDPSMHAGDIYVKLNNNSEAVLLWSELITWSNNGPPAFGPGPWFEPPSNQRNIYAAQRNSSGVWSWPSSNVDRIALPSAYSFVRGITMNDVGDIIVVWVNGSFGGSYLSYKAKDASSWTVPASFNDSVKFGSGDAIELNYTYIMSSKIDDSGHVEIIWWQNNLNKNTIYKMENPKLGQSAWQVPASLSDSLLPAGSDVYQISHIDLKNGDSEIYYADENFLEIYRIQKQSGVWKEAEFISKSSGYVSNFSAIAGAKIPTLIYTAPSLFKRDLGIRTVEYKK